MTVVFGILIGAIINHLSRQLPCNKHLTYPKCSNCLMPISFERLFAVTQIRLNKCICGDKNNNLIRELLTELFFAISLPILASLVQSFVQTVAFIALLTSFILIARIDAEHKIIPNAIIYSTTLIAFISSSFQHNIFNNPQEINKILLSGLAGYFIMLILFHGGNLYKKILIKRHRIINNITVFGMGDVRLGCIIGIVTGWPNLLHALLLGIFISGIVSMSIFLRKSYKPFTTLPLSPFMILSTIIIMIANIN